MLLYSTVLDINDTLTKDDFIRLVIKWNQESIHPENVIPGIKWIDEKNIRYGNENMWLDIQEYRNMGILLLSSIKKQRQMVPSGIQIM